MPAPVSWARVQLTPCRRSRRRNRATRRSRRSLAEYLEDLYRRQPTQATDLGDPQVPTISWRTTRGRRSRTRSRRAPVPRSGQRHRPVVAVRDNQLDREQLLHAIDSRLLTLDVVRPWARDADTYSSGLTNTAYIMIKREFAPPEERLRKLIAREKAMPAALAEARKNLENPPRIYTQIAIDQLDGNREFFQTAVPEAFTNVTDKALLAEFKSGERRRDRRARRLQEVAAERIC